MSLTSSQSTPLFLIVLAVAVGYLAYEGLEPAGMPGLSARKVQVTAIQDTIAQLEGETAKAKAELAKGTVEDLRRRLDVYRSSLALLRRDAGPLGPGATARLQVRYLAPPPTSGLRLEFQDTGSPGPLLLDRVGRGPAVGV